MSSIWDDFVVAARYIDPQLQFKVGIIDTMCEMRPPNDVEGDPDVVTAIRDLKSQYKEAADKVIDSDVKLKDARKKIQKIKEVTQALSGSKWETKMKSICDDVINDESLKEIVEDAQEKYNKFWRLRQGFRELCSVEQSNKFLCSVCMRDDIDSVINPCGHAICGGCVSRLSNCPYCRTDISCVIKIYRP